MAIPLNLRRQKSGPTSNDDCRTTVITDISHTLMIVAVTRLGVNTAYLQEPHLCKLRVILDGVIVLRWESGRFIGEYFDSNGGFKLATLSLNTLLIQSTSKYPYLNS
ncbi:hypothetical protein K0M31_013737 [Melipona bicolor]|uniref:Uncharacterized protein n=1 Tax=Melipona bicolor TaxID=60889 RepID=A0AA40FH56_9HYME|nr:hypothetical protein K0M31_013737 [Melipona bicolor]